MKLHRFICHVSKAQLGMLVSPTKMLVLPALVALEFALDTCKTSRWDPGALDGQKPLKQMKIAG